jgi:hypothetical protein
MYFSVRPPFPFGAGSLSSSFFSPLAAFGYFSAVAGLISAGFSTLRGYCCFLSAASAYFFACYSLAFFFNSAS